jgi:hypothetical protein
MWSSAGTYILDKTYLHLYGRTIQIYEPPKEPDHACKKFLTFIENRAGILLASQHPISGILLKQEKGLSSFQNSPS